MNNERFTDKMKGDDELDQAGWTALRAYNVRDSTWEALC